MNKAALVALVLSPLATSGCLLPAELVLQVPTLATGGTYVAEAENNGLVDATFEVGDPGVVELVEVREGVSEYVADVVLGALAAGETTVLVSGPVEGSFDVVVKDPTEVEPSYRGWLALLARDTIAAPRGAELVFHSPWMAADDDLVFGEGAYSVSGSGGLVVEPGADDGFRVRVNGGGSFTVDTAGLDRTVRVEIADPDNITSLQILTDPGAVYACVEAIAAGRAVLGARAAWSVGNDPIGTGTCLKTPPTGTEGAEDLDVTVSLTTSAGTISVSAPVYADPADLTLE